MFPARNMLPTACCTINDERFSRRFSSANYSKMKCRQLLNTFKFSGYSRQREMLEAETL